MSHSLHSLCAVFLFTRVEMLQSPPHSHIDRSVTFEEYFRWSIMMCGDGAGVRRDPDSEVGVAVDATAPLSV